ncbi:hypothetical protein M426DRAFT_21951 [Hypoxylon sp. CI-4A]|nr:hypothetical protein M426DRAFT_21951 [Hypoxylon sp. CI-4A]
MAPTIDIIRHAESQHNVSIKDVSDPEITNTGTAQCEILRRSYPYSNMVTRVFSSPLKRAIDTALRSTSPAIKNRIKFTLLPELQEINCTQSGRGTSRYKLELHYSHEHLDTTELTEDWYRKGPDTAFFPDPAKVDERARVSRAMIRQAAKEAVASGKDDAHIVVVTHGEFAHWLTNDFVGTAYKLNTGWANTEWRSYQFTDVMAPQNVDVQLVETQESVERRDADPATLVTAMSDHDKMIKKRLAAIRVREHGRAAEDPYAIAIRMEEEARQEILALDYYRVIHEREIYELNRAQRQREASGSASVFASTSASAPAQHRGASPVIPEEDDNKENESSIIDSDSDDDLRTF